MAFSGVHIVAATVANVGAAPLLGRGFWSETIASPGISTQRVPNDIQPVVFEIAARAACYFAHGDLPDASHAIGTGQTARLLCLAGATRNVYTSSGARIAVVPAGLNEVHIACCPVVEIAPAKPAIQRYQFSNKAPLPTGKPMAGQPAWSETMTAPGTATRAALPDRRQLFGFSAYCFLVAAPADIYVAIGQTPDPTQASGTGDAARTFIEGGSERVLNAPAGDYLAWCWA